MTTTIDRVPPIGTRFRELTTVGRARYVAFTAVVLASLGFVAVMIPAELALAVTGWFVDFGVHQVHDQMIFAFIWVALVVPMALLLHRPTRRVNTVLAPLVFTIPWTVMAVLVDSPILMLGAIFGVFGVLALALHPAGRSLVAFDRVDAVDRGALGVFIVGAVPLTVYAGLEVVKQLGPVDDHVLFVHYGTMAVAAALVVVMGALAVLRRRDWRFAAWSAGATAAYLGVLSVAYPTVESSLGLVGGVLVLAWAIAFVASVEIARRDGPRSGEGTTSTDPEPSG